jgi:hypothetical protein
MQKRGHDRYIHTYIHIYEISVKSGKDSTSTLNLAIHKVRLKINLQKSTLAFKGGGEI